MDALDSTETQAIILSEMIKDIPDSDLMNFFVFRTKYIMPMQSRELITKNALFDYRAIQYKSKILDGSFKFETKEQINEFLLTYYRGKNIGNGLGDYYDFVVIALDNDGEMINKYLVDDFTGKYRKLSGDDVDKVLEYLLENQTKLGDVKYIPYSENQLESDKKSGMPLVGARSRAV